MLNFKRIIKMTLVMFALTVITFFSKGESVSANSIPADAIEWNGHYYYVYNINITWDEAKVACENLGGHLATVTSAEEWEFIKQRLNPGRAWLGGYADNNREWHWVTGEIWSYTAWEAGEPNNETDAYEPEDKLHIWESGWNDLRNSSSERVGYICEWDYSVTLSDSKIQLYKGNSAFLTCAVTDASGNYIDASATYKSDNLSVAKVSTQGKIVAVGAGEATITVKAKGISKTCKVIVRPQKVSGIKAISRTKNSIQLKWKKQNNISKYQILMYDKDLGEYTVVKSVNGKINSAIVKRLKKNKKYKFKIRAAIKSDGKNYYGDYSKVYKSKTSK